MAKFRVEEIRDKQRWEQFVLSKRPATFLQSWNWGEVQSLIGNRIFRLGFFEGKKLVGGSLVILESARRGKYLVIPGGPCIDWQRSDLVDFVLAEIRDLGAGQGAGFVRLRPEVIDSVKARKQFASLGFISAPMHLHAEHTWVLDITPSSQKLLAGMRKSTRYLVRKSLKMDLELEIKTKSKAAKVLKSLQDETVKRHKFVGFPEKLFEAQLEAFGTDKQIGMFICKKGKKVLAAAIVIFYASTAYYHHSGSTLKYPKIPASHFLQWQIILEAKRRNCKTYNFWGIAPDDNPRHRFAGVTLFKRGFSGKRVDWLHAQDLPLSAFYWLTFSFETGRRILRGL